MVVVPGDMPERELPVSASINPEHIITLQGQQYCTYRGVLECAHSLGLEGIRTRILQVPGPDNDHVAIVEAEVRLKDGRVFVDVADASPKNVHARLATALIRLASTRAKGRALRDAVNIGEVLAEELPDVEAEQPLPAAPSRTPARAAAAPARAMARASESDTRESAPSPAPRAAAHAGESDARESVPPARTPPPVVNPPLQAEPEPAAPHPVAPAVEAPPAEHVCSSPDCGRSVTQGQYNFSIQKFGQPLCPACQRRQQSREKATA
jgi:hypothetical protein